MTLIIENDPVHLARRGADLFLQIAQKSVSVRGQFTVAVSGGSTPRAMHRLFSEGPHPPAIPWDRTHMFWVDERCVPATDPRSNYGAARSDFLDRVPIPAHQVHPMPAALRPEQGAVAYEKELLHFFQKEQLEIPVIDLICLGIGTDGHTASLFPGHRALEEQERMVVPVRGGTPYVDRLTMTLPLLTNARHVLFIASGPDKAPILKTLLEGRPGRLPAQMVQPVHGSLAYLIDEEAGSMLRHALHSPAQIQVSALDRYGSIGSLPIPMTLARKTTTRRGGVKQTENH